MKPKALKTETLEVRTRILGQRLLAQVEQEQDKRKIGWLDMLISHAVEDQKFRLQVLRFIDVLPMLQDDAELATHLKEYFGDQALPLPVSSHWGLQHSDSRWAAPIVAPLVRKTFGGLSQRFMAGQDLRQVLRTLSRLHHQGMGYSLDLLGEAVLSEEEAGRYQQAYLDLLRQLARATGDKPGQRPHVSLKLSSLYSQITAEDPRGSVRAIAERLRPLLRTAREAGVAITVDMEQYDFKHIVLQCFMSVLAESEYRDWSDVGIAIQAYLKDARDDLQVLLDWVALRGTPVQIRLVRGAYWDYETVLARQHGWEVPVWQQKSRTDAAYEACLELLCRYSDGVRLAVASHNVRSLAYAMALAEHQGLSEDRFEFQMLFGMADELQHALVNLGYPLRVYVPFGETLPGMAYLVRRLLENSSGQSNFQQGLMRTGAAQTSLEKPQAVTVEAKPEVVSDFANQIPHRFTRTDERESVERAILAVEARLDEAYPLLIAGESVEGAGWISSTNPARPGEIIGRVALADRAMADRALQAAKTAAPDWRRLSAGERAAWLRKLARALLHERDQFAAWQILEAGKNWREADADVCEAIDFLQYYAGQAERLAQHRIVELSGEHNRHGYRPKGIGLVIAPWNFPLAILTGMLAATIVTGNTAIVKPSSLTPVIAARLMGLIQRVGLPPGVVNFLPGPGSEVGEYLAASPEVNLIAFTGSREVGGRLLGIGAQIAPGQRHVKRVIAEMGGKNALIVDTDADLDEAVAGVVRSAFGFQGQKCSAASRVIAVGKVYDTLVERLVAATRSLSLGDPRQPGNFLGPVIDAKARARIGKVIEAGSRRARLLCGGDRTLPDQGHYLAPHIFGEVAPTDPLAQDEIFGPVLAILRAKDFEQALSIANATSYALTGGVYSRRPSHLQRAREAFEVGNLYLNRGITGALVSRQPFGGFKLSGVGSKAGGSDYLLQFMDPVCVTENTLRRGFAPELGRRT
jgi:RHH-type proline utilization regulon transcriptional repressor/proline dehydrogenase/delta 1-pyrroline-5-carboxylate dehydrogenase